MIAANSTDMRVPMPSRRPSPSDIPRCTSGTTAMTSAIAGRGRRSSTHWLTSTTRNSVVPTPASIVKSTNASGSWTAT